MKPETDSQTVGVNCDMGESYGIYTLGSDEELLRYITAANVACGFHAGDPTVMAATVDAALENGVAVGAHPSLPDRQGFGRRAMAVGAAELENLLTYQVGALNGFLHARGVPLSHLKVHGALYGMTAGNLELARVACTVASRFGVPIYGMAGSAHESAAAECGIDFVSEFYADLDYSEDGSLLITRTHAAVDPETAVDRVRRAIAEGRVRAREGTDVAVRADTVCVHSDTPNAAMLAAAVAAAVAVAAPTREESP